MALKQYSQRKVLEFWKSASNNVEVPAKLKNFYVGNK